jgi:hypothetical protein
LLECIWNNSIMIILTLSKFQTMPLQAEEEENHYDFWTQQAKRHLQRRERETCSWHLEIKKNVILNFFWFCLMFKLILIHSPFFLMWIKFFHPLPHFFSIKWKPNQESIKQSTPKKNLKMEKKVQEGKIQVQAKSRSH